MVKYCPFCPVTADDRFVVEPGEDGMDELMDHLVCDHGIEPDVAQEDAVQLKSAANYRSRLTNEA